MYSGLDTFCDNWKYEPEPCSPRSQFQSSKVGFPIRKSTDQRLFAPTRSLSQRTTSFFASYRQGIHQMPLGHLIALISNAHRVSSRLSPLGENGIGRINIRLGAHCTERPEVNQDKPNSRMLACAISSRSSTSIVRTTNALGARQRLRRRSGISPLYDVKKTARDFSRRNRCSQHG
jgi:hypothetical protein